MRRSRGAVGEVGLPSVGDEEGSAGLELEAEARRSEKGLLSAVRWAAKGSLEEVVGEVGDVGDLLPPAEMRVSLVGVQWRRRSMKRKT